MQLRVVVAPVVFEKHNRMIARQHLSRRMKDVRFCPLCIDVHETDVAQVHVVNSHATDCFTCQPDGDAAVVYACGTLVAIEAVERHRAVVTENRAIVDRRVADAVGLQVCK